MKIKILLDIIFPKSENNALAVKLLFEFTVLLFSVLGALLFSVFGLFVFRTFIPSLVVVMGLVIFVCAKRCVVGETGTVNWCSKPIVGGEA